MLSHRTVFNEYIVPATMETFAEQVRLFNEASNGAIVLDAANFRGDFIQQAFFDSLIGAQRRVDRYTPNTEVAQTEITDHTQTGVKVAGGFGPIVYEPSTMTWLNEPTARGIEIASRNFADALLYDQINTALNATIAAISGNADAVYGTTTAELTYDVINMAHARFGAASGSIIVDVMNGLQYHKFISKNLTNANSLFSAGNVQVVDILGKKVVVVDAPSLTAVDGTQRVLGLTRGAVTVGDSGDIITNVDTVNGKQRIETTFQADYTFTLGIKGYSWDQTTGGKSPLDAELATSANWGLISSSIKTTAGVLAIGT